jgi:hypothetical protein
LSRKNEKDEPAARRAGGQKNRNGPMSKHKYVVEEEKRHGRAVVDVWLDPDDIDALDRLALQEDSSRSRLIRRAVKIYLHTKSIPTSE